MDEILDNILSFPSQLTRKGLESESLSFLSRSKPDGIIVTGMGGSGLAGDIIVRAKEELGVSVPIITWKNYGVPAHPFKRPLYVYVSFSGNTEETLSGIRDLLKKKTSASTLCTVSTGGALQSLSKKHNLPSVWFEPGVLTPRQSTGRMFYGIIDLLLAAHLVRPPKEFTHIDAEKYRTAGEALAKKLHRKIIFIYTPEPYAHIGYITKITFNETSKSFAFSHTLPEMTHNEIVGFDTPDTSIRNKSAAIFFTTKSPARLYKRSCVAKDLIEKRGILVEEIPLNARTILENTWTAQLLIEWTSYYLAKLSGISPKETPIIEHIKAVMKK